MNNLLLIGLILTIYPLFGFMIIFIKNRLGKTKKIHAFIIAPVGLSFVLGIGLLIYAILSM